MNTLKANLREKLIGRMRTMAAEDVVRLSKVVCGKALREFDWSQVETVLAYTPIKGSGEIDPQYLLGALGTTIKIDFVETGKSAPFLTRKYDVIIVPVVGFNSSGYRLGRGGGWYDRLFAAHPESLSIGLAYHWAKVNFVPERHDKQLSKIITDETDAV
jgi:5-formyltetrahydrofolate cyclo-ligase